MAIYKGLQIKNLILLSEILFIPKQKKKGGGRFSSSDESLTLLVGRPPCNSPPCGSWERSPEINQK
jgi:hypothetical protein